MADHNLALASASFIAIHALLKKNKQVRNKRRWWASQLYLKREIEMKTSTSNDRVVKEESGRSKHFARMSQSDFNLIFNAIRDKISKNDTVFRKAVPPELRLAVTLRFLATGDSFTSLQYMFKISKQLISDIIPNVCRAIIDFLKDYTKRPVTPEEWKIIADGFNERWNFPNCIGAVEGKRVMLQVPMNTGCEQRDKKFRCSIDVTAIVDADYNFVLVDTVPRGPDSAGGVSDEFKLYEELERGDLKLPEPSALLGRKMKIPYVLLGDESFPLDENITRPYSGIYPIGSPERVFNHRLSRGRRAVENAFGFVASVFRVLRRPILLQPEKAELIVMTVITLHNFLRRSETSKHLYAPVGSMDRVENGEVIAGSWRNDQQGMKSLLPLERVVRKTKLVGQGVRDELTEYFSNCGSVSWQNQ